MKAYLRPVLLGAAVLAMALTGCSATPSTPETTGPTTSTTTTATSSATSTDLGTVVQVRLADGKVTPNGEKMDLKVGDVLTLVINSDHDDEVHVHGIDVEIEVTAGQEVTRTVTLDQAGSFEVESHEPQKVILVLNVR